MQRALPRGINLPLQSDCFVARRRRRVPALEAEAAGNEAGVRPLLPYPTWAPPGKSLVEGEKGNTRKSLGICCDGIPKKSTREASFLSSYCLVREMEKFPPSCLFNDLFPKETAVWTEAVSPSRREPPPQPHAVTCPLCMTTNLWQEQKARGELVASHRKASTVTFPS